MISLRETLKKRKPKKKADREGLDGTAPDIPKLGTLGEELSNLVPPQNLE